MGARSRGRVVGTILWIAATGGTSAGDGREIAVARPRERLATVRGVHEAQRARLALLPPAPEEPDVVTTRVAATAAMQAEVEAIDAAEAAGAQPAQLDGAVLAAVGSIVRGGQALAAFEHAVALARIKRTAREGGARVVPGLYFAPGTDRFHAIPSGPALDELERLLDQCPDIAVAFVGRPADARSIAGGRAAELASYFIQSGVPSERIFETNAAIEGDPQLDALGLPAAARPAPAPGAGEEADIVVTVVRRCR